MPSRLQTLLPLNTSTDDEHSVSNALNVLQPEQRSAIRDWDWKEASTASKTCTACKSNLVTTHRPATFTFRVLIFVRPDCNALPAEGYTCVHEDMFTCSNSFLAI